MLNQPTPEIFLTEAKVKIEQLINTKVRVFYIREDDPITFEQVKNAVCFVTGIEWELILSKTNKGPVVEARHLFFYIMRMYTDYTTTKLGILFNKDHTTICNSTRRITDFLSVKDERIRNKVTEIKTILKV